MYQTPLGSDTKKNVFHLSHGIKNIHRSKLYPWYRPVALLTFLAHAQWLVGRSLEFTGNQNIIFINLICAEVIPSSCCALGCSNRRIPGSSLSFYRIPSGDSEKEKERRLKWLNAIHRDKWSEEEIRNVWLCSAHFISGTRIVASHIAVSWCICFTKATTCLSPFKTWIYCITFHLFIFFLGKRSSNPLDPDYVSTMLV